MSKTADKATVDQLTKDLATAKNDLEALKKQMCIRDSFGTAHVYRSSLNAIIAYSGKVDFTFDEVSPEWLKGFEVYLRSRGCLSLIHIFPQ